MTSDLNFDPKGTLIIEDVYAWMDGGTVSLVVKDEESKSFDVAFVQKAFLTKRDNAPYPGSLLLNKQEVKLRSETESRIISAIRKSDWGSRIAENEKRSMRLLINEAVDFVLSDKYLEVAKIVGR